MSEWLDSIHIFRLPRDVETSEFPEIVSVSTPDGDALVVMYHEVSLRRMFHPKEARSFRVIPSSGCVPGTEYPGVSIVGVPASPETFTREAAEKLFTDGDPEYEAQAKIMVDAIMKFTEISSGAAGFFIQLSRDMYLLVMFESGVNQMLIKKAPVKLGGYPETGPLFLSIGDTVSDALFHVLPGFIQTVLPGAEPDDPLARAYRAAFSIAMWKPIVADLKDGVEAARLFVPDLVKAGLVGGDSGPLRGPGR